MDYNSFVPLGIPAFGGEKENGKIHFTYDIIFEDASELTLQIRERHKEIYKEIITEKKRLTKGLHYWQWDGFDNAGILDTSKIIGKSLNLYITARSKRGSVVRKCLDFKLSYSEVNWVDVKINRPDKKIFITLRVDLKDGGDFGLQNPSNKKYMYVGGMERGKIELEIVPTSIIKSKGFPLISSRTRSFKQLEQLALEGIAYHWSRNKLPTSNVATGVSIVGQNYEVFVKAVNTTQNAMDDISLIYNTNNDWMRSGNPNTVTGVISFFGNILSREAVCYNVGYIKYSDGWSYQKEIDEDKEFKDTAAHEVGHEILKAYGDVYYSYGHKGSVNTITQKRKDDAPKFPLTGEIDLMPYFKDNKYGGKYFQHNYYGRRVASEEDVKSLIWLTKMIIEK